jgi:hypothetical protein
MMDEYTDPGFAPADPTDERQLGDWKTRYSEPDAKRRIRIEASYLFIHLFGVVLAVFLVAVLREPSAPSPSPTASLSHPEFGWVQILHAWLGGVLGGSIFSIKWLIHVVPKNLWNMDRSLWRLLTPHVSGAFAFAFVTLLASGMLVVIHQESLSSPWMCFGLGFLIGYFSDSATAKLSEVARALFGETRRNESVRRPRIPNPPKQPDDAPKQG